MFLTAVGKAGVIGAWPFATKYKSTRETKRGPKGTELSKCINVDGNIWADSIIQNVMPAIRSKMSNFDEVVFQLDNAMPHKRSSIQKRL